MANPSDAQPDALRETIKKLVHEHAQAKRSVTALNHHLTTLRQVVTQTTDRSARLQKIKQVPIIEAKLDAAQRQADEIHQALTQAKAELSQSMATPTNPNPATSVLYRPVPLPSRRGGKWLLAAVLVVFAGVLGYIAWQPPKPVDASPAPVKPPKTDASWTVLDRDALIPRLEMVDPRVIDDARKVRPEVREAVLFYRDAGWDAKRLAVNELIASLPTDLTVEELEVILGDESDEHRYELLHMAIVRAKMKSLPAGRALPLFANATPAVRARMLELAEPRMTGWWTAGQLCAVLGDLSGYSRRHAILQMAHLIQKPIHPLFRQELLSYMSPEDQQAVSRALFRQENAP